MLLIALALGLLILFCPGRSAASEMQPSSDLLVPFFEVDLDDPQGLTTLFSLVNDSPWAVDVQMTVHSNWGIPMLTIPLKLNGDEVRSFNLRDWFVRGDLPDRDLSPAELAHVQAALSGKPSPNDNLYYGTEVARDLAVGYVILRATGPDRPDVLWGDYFVVEARRDYFQAETLVDIDPESCAPITCRRHAVRFLDGGSLADGTQLLIWTERRWPPSPIPDPPWGTVNTDLKVYDEPGRHVEDRALDILPVEMLKVGDLKLKPRFGWLEVVTDERSFITQHLHTTGAPSAALHAWCLPEEAAETPGPGIELQKFVNGADADDPTGPSISVGAAVTWVFWVRNIGTVPLTDVEVTDSSGEPVICHQTTLDPQETMECTLGGIAKACQQHNLGRVEATAPDFTTVSDEDHAWYFGDPHGSLGLKTLLNGFAADGPEGTWPQFDAGDQIHWTIEVTNTGDVELTQVAVTAGSLPVTCPKTVLQPGESMTCTATSVAEAGLHKVEVAASGATPCGTVANVSQAGYANYFVVVLEPAIDLEKLVNGQDADVPPGPTVELGAPLTWSFVVTNVGDVPLSGIAVTDPSFTVTCPKTELAVGESMTCTVPGTAQACQASNLATVTAIAPDTSAVTDQDPAHYFGQHHAALTLEKLIGEQDADTAPGPDLRTGTTAHWTYVVTNAGDVPLTGVAVTDDRLAAVTCPKTELAAGESMTCAAEAAVVAGQYRNVGTAVGTPPCGPAVSASDPAHYYGRSPGIALEKLTNGEDADTPTGPAIPVGSPVLWTYVVTNTGDTVLTNVAVTDDKGVAVTCPKTSLSPGESMTCTASGTAAAGQYANVGTATGTPTVGPDVTATDPSHYFGYRPLLTLEKRVNGQDADTPPGPSVLVGSTLSWTYLVTNTGDVKLTSVSVTDDQGLTVTCPKTALEAGESMTCTASSKAEAGQHKNVATATGTPPSGPAVTATDPAHYLGLVPGISLEKLVNGDDADTAPGPTFLVGTPLLWTYIVKNTGEVTLTNITVTDSDGFAVDCPKTTLTPGESMTCSACALAAFEVKCPAYCLAIAGQQANIGRATGTPNGGDPIWAEDPAHYYGEVLGNQGCTPGYWKNHTGSWPPTGYTTGQDVDTVFANVNTYYPALGNASLLQALSFAGGPGGEGAAEILLRAAVAALLNASHPDVAYPRTPGSIISDVNNALLQTRDSMLALAAQLDADNNLGCPLN